MHFKNTEVRDHALLVGFQQTQQQTRLFKGTHT